LVGGGGDEKHVWSNRKSGGRTYTRRAM